MHVLFVDDCNEVDLKLSCFSEFFTREHQLFICQKLSAPNTVNGRYVVFIFLSYLLDKCRKERVIVTIFMVSIHSKWFICTVYLRSYLMSSILGFPRLIKILKYP